MNVIIPIHEKDINGLHLVIKGLIKNIPIISEIVIIGNANIKMRMNSLENNCFVKYLNEDEILQGLTLSSIKELIFSRIEDDNRAGWYFQQFIKMAYSKFTKEDYYLIWDADTIPLNPIHLFEISTEKPLFDYSYENHKPYFKTLKKLLPSQIRDVYSYSFIKEHMVINRKSMLELIFQIEKNKDIPGNDFWEKIINAIDKDDLSKSGFSEFETYGNFVYNLEQDTFSIRKIKSCRYSKIILGELNEAKLNWASKSFDIISCENWNRQIFIGKFFDKNFILTNFISLRILIQLGLIYLRIITATNLLLKRN